MSKPPSFMLNKPSPVLKQRLYNGRRIPVYEGRVPVESITGWIDNPRIEIQKKRLQETIGHREPTQDEIFELMKGDPEVELKKLRDDVMKNGLREPLTLSNTGKLLDGNRRFFALRYVLETMPAPDPNRQDFETVDAFVLTEAATEKDEEDVLVEENFSASLKIEWPPLVKARRVMQALESGKSVEEIARRFAWDVSKVKDTKKIHTIVEDFMAFATENPDPEDELGGGLGLHEREAELVASKQYQMFNEAQKSFYEPLQTDIEFKAHFFRWIAEGKFRSFQETRIAYRAWKHPEARAAIVRPDPTAAKDAKAILDYNQRIVRGGEEAFGRIKAFTDFLKQLEVQEVKALPDQAVDLLKEALATVTQMASAAKPST